MKAAVKYCAIYTRKSTDERLDMEFNSLDAQREACEAYITSQKSEGWVAVKQTYDDGGFSGGTMERPALKQLMNDIRAGKVNVIVVYKIDRLTRSLMDFSKLVETFDQYGVTFVSITQSFNTTTSMGRLTLNVLLSFAQFERKVAGERIRDKIAASKRKGMWMGGYAPIGYDGANRQLAINPDEAQKVKHIFERYLKLGSVAALKRYLDQAQIYSKVRQSKKGASGNTSFSRGALYTLLSNPVYLGQTRHKDKTYEGQHEAIIDLETWEAAQQKLKEGNGANKGHTKLADGELLKGLLFDPMGTPYSSTYTVKANKHYRYYLSQNLLQNRNHPKGMLARLPAHEIEKTVMAGLKEQLTSVEKLAAILKLDCEVYQKALSFIAEQYPSLLAAGLFRTILKKVIVDSNYLTLQLDTVAFIKIIGERLKLDLPNCQIDTIANIAIPYHTRKSDKGAIVIQAKTANTSLLDLPASDLKRLVQGHIWREQHFGGLTIRQIAERDSMSDTYINQQILHTFETA